MFSLSNWLMSMGFTRDSATWFWGRLVSGALLVLSGLVPLDGYVSEPMQKVITVGAAVVLWLSGKFDSSPLPGKKQ